MRTAWTAFGVAGFLLSNLATATAVASSTTITSGRAEVITVDIRSAMTFEADRVLLRSASGAAFYFRRIGRSTPEGGVAVLPELGDSDRLLLGEATTRLPGGRYEFSVITLRTVVIQLPIPAKSIRILRRRPIARPGVTIADLSAPTGTPAGRWQAATTVQPHTLVLGVLRAEFTSPVGTESLELCVAPHSVPCSVQDGYGVSSVNTRTAPMEETVRLVYVETPTMASNRTAQAQIVGLDTVTSARAVLFVGALN